MPIDLYNPCEAESLRQKVWDDQHNFAIRNDDQPSRGGASADKSPRLKYHVLEMLSSISGRYPDKRRRPRPHLLP
jgi:hypothetical protein